MSIITLINVILTFILFVLPLTGDMLNGATFGWRKYYTWKFGLATMLAGALAAGTAFNEYEKSRLEELADIQTQNFHRYGYFYAKEKDSLHTKAIISAKDSTILMLSRYGLKVDAANNEIKSSIDETELATEPYILPSLEYTSDTTIKCNFANTGKATAHQVQAELILVVYTGASYDIDLLYAINGSLSIGTGVRHEVNITISKNKPMYKQPLFLGLKCSFESRYGKKFSMLPQLFSIVPAQRKSTFYSWQNNELNEALTNNGFFEKIQIQLESKDK